jgi:hypothetical protein
MKKAGLFLLSFFFASVVFAAQIAVFDDFITPDDMLLDEDHLYIVEGPVIYIYSRENFKLLETFGQGGEGPREFKGAITVNVQDDYILVTSRRRVSFFTKDGDYLKEFNRVAGKLFKPLGKKGFAGHDLIGESGGKRFHTVNLYDLKFKKTRMIFKEEAIIPSARKSGWHLFAKTFSNSLVQDNKIFVVGRKDFVIEVYDFNGNSLYSIEAGYEKVRFTEEHKQNVLRLYKTRPTTKHDYEDYWKHALNFPDYFPAIRKFFSDGKHLYVRTYLQNDQGYEFFIFDFKGKLLKKVYLPMGKSNAKYAFPYMKDHAPFGFKDGNYYYLVENEESEEWNLHMMAIK